MSYNSNYNYNGNAMSAERASSSLVNRLSISSTQKNLKGYYRSKLFITPFTTNPLLTAAGPLFSVIERLYTSHALPPVGAIRDNIEHELHAFHSKLIASNYPVELIAIAHYLLGATIDELLGKSYLRLNLPIQFQAFTPLSNDGVEPQHRFFEIVRHIKQTPNQHLDLIELAYFCLIAGFEGELHLLADGRQILDNLIEELYSLIQQYRVNKPNKLFNEAALPTLAPDSSHLPMILTVLITACVLSLSFVGSHALLNNKAKHVILAHAQLAARDD